MTKRGSRQKNPGNIHKVSGNLLYAVASASSVGLTNLSPDNSTGFGQFGAKLAQISDAFALYRFTALSFEVLASGGITQGDTFVYVGYSPEVTSSAPATGSNHIDLPFSFLISLRQTGVMRKSVPRKLLMATGVPWFRTRGSGSYDDNLEFQGIVSQRTPGATDTLTMLIHYTIEFKDFIGPAQTPMRELQVSRCVDSSQSPKEVPQQSTLDPQQGRATVNTLACSPSRSEAPSGFVYRLCPLGV